ELGLTNKRVISKTGIISRRSEEMKLGSIETVEIDQGVLGRILGYGNIRVSGRGISDVVLDKVADPMTVKRAIESISHPAA
ncbi:MAG: PH domain-containing protein, partial [Betaproteobacteria bacterium]